LRVVPLFLLQGVHVAEDIPAELAQAQARLAAIARPPDQPAGHTAAVELLPPMGLDPTFGSVVKQQQQCCQQQHSDLEAWVLLSHGSRRPGGNRAAEAIAAEVGAVTAYWSVEPSLDHCLDQLDRQGVRRVGILPYFLFAGGITDAIAQMVTHQRDRRPHLHLGLGPVLDHDDQLATWLHQWLERDYGRERDHA
jgi:sirohydrochlorin ferrochelatase